MIQEYIAQEIDTYVWENEQQYLLKSRRGRLQPMDQFVVNLLQRHSSLITSSIIPTAY